MPINFSKTQMADVSRFAAEISSAMTEKDAAMHIDACKLLVHGLVSSEQFRKMTGFDPDVWEGRK